MARRSTGRFPRSPKASKTMAAHIARQGTKGNRTPSTRTYSSGTDVQQRVGGNGNGTFDYAGRM